MKNTLLFIVTAFSLFSCTKSAINTKPIEQYKNRQGIKFNADHNFTYTNAGDSVTYIPLDPQNAVDGKKATISLAAIGGYNLDIKPIESGSVEFETGSLLSKNLDTRNYIVTITFHAARGSFGEYFSVLITSPN